MKTPTINSRVVKLEVLKGTATRTSVNAVESRTTSLESDVATAQGDISTLQTDVSAAEGNISTLQGNVTTLTQGIQDAVSTHNTAPDAHADIRTALAGKQDAGNFAGSSTPGGAATTALACTGNAATATTAASCTGNSATATTASSCSGNAATATALATARTLTIGSTGKTFNGSANVSWTLAEIGAVSQEVGTWTPSFTAATAPTGVTYSSRVGKYIKTGVDCTVEFLIGMTSKGSGGSGNAIFYGLPFAAYNSTYSLQWKGPVGFIFNMTTPDDAFKLAWGVVDNSTICYLGRNGGGYYIEQWSDLTATTTVYGSFKYRTAA